MITIPTTVTSRIEYSTSRIEKLREKVGNISVLSEEVTELCIYVTGSYGRFEASKNSDLDLFFINIGCEEDNCISNIKKTLIDADIINMCRELGLPEFSDDGRYLEVHYLKDILSDLGSPKDDYKNYFTARMLLLLESVFIYNNELFKECAKEIVASYYRDYHDHEEDFKPIFLVNDIIRFWKTLCLNYEHKRNRPPEDKERKIKSHLKNLKLKFSRMLTCFSMILILSKNREIVTPEKLFELIEIRPIERIIEISKVVSNANELISSLLEDYAWFLDITGQSKEVLFEWISEEKNRNEAFGRARQFGKKMYDLLLEVVSDTDTLRYIMI